MKKLLEAEVDGTAMTKQVDTLKRTLRKIERVSETALLSTDGGPP